MKKIRIGNDIKIEWSIFKKSGGVFLLEGLDLIVSLKDKFGRKKIDDFVISGNVIKWTFPGKDQRRTGIYSLELVINNGAEGMITTDACQFVNLVACSCDVAGSDESGVYTETIELRSALTIGEGGGEGGGEGYDDTAIWEALNDKVDKVKGKGLSTNDYTNAEKSKLAGLENYDDTKLKEDIENLSKKVEDLEQGGGEGCECATPDWSVPEGKEGHILNRTHYKDVEILENGGLKTNDDGEPISPNYIRFRNEYGNLSDLIIVNDYTDGSYIDGVPVYDEYGDPAEYIYGTLLFQPDNWTIRFTPEGDGIYYVDSVYGSLKQLDEEFIPDTIARKSELTELSAQVGGLSERVDNLPTAESSLFEAVYGETPYNDIIAASKARKHVICYYKNFIYNLTKCQEGYDIKFSCADMEVLTIICKVNGGWSTSNAGHELIMNKVTSLSEKSTDTQYPSAKAVYDFVNNTLGTIINGEY